MPTQNNSSNAVIDPETVLPAPPSLSQRPPENSITKAAILLVTIGKEAASEVLRFLDEDEVETVTQAVARLSTFPAERAEDVLGEIERGLANSNPIVIKGGVEYAKKILAEAFGEQTGQSIVERLLKSLGTDAADIVALQKSDPAQLARLIQGEHPQVIALVLSHLVPAQGAALLMALPLELRADVTRRMAQIDQFSPEIVERLASYIGRRLRALGEFSRESYGGVRAVAEMLNRLNAQVNEELLTTISKTNDSLTTDIRRFMFLFEDLLKLSQDDIRNVVQKTDRKTLALALKTASDRLQKWVTEGLTRRGTEMLMEEIEVMGPVKVKDVEAAQSKIVSVVWQLQAEGVIGRADRGDKYI